jgi:hypothetical protein
MILGLFATFRGHKMNDQQRDLGSIEPYPQFAMPLQAEGPGPHLLGAETLIGQRVLNLKDETLGDIKDIMLDVNTGQVGYAVLSCRRYFGLSEKLFAVPWALLTLHPLQQCFVMDLTPEQLKTARDFWL